MTNQINELMELSPIEDLELDQLKIEWLREAIALGIKDFEEGRFETYTAETLNDLSEKIMTEGRAELQKLELDRRKAEYQANPTPLLSWEEVEANILKKYGEPFSSRY